jgi:drug/metabolite transporter (DMT)-like permease
MPPAPHHSQHQLGVAAIGVAVTSWGLTGVLIKSLDIGAIAIAFWRFGTFAVVLAVVHQVRGGRFTLSLMRKTLPAGALLAGDVILFFTAIKLTAIVNATTIGALQPLLIAGVAARFFGERIRRRELIAAALAITGVVVIVTQSAGTPEWNGWGDLAAVGALCSWSTYFIVAKRGGSNFTPVEFTIGTGLWVAIFALPVGLIAGQDMGLPARSEWVPLIALLTVGGLFGHMLMNWAIPRVALWLSSTMTLFTPVVSSVAAWVWLDEPLTTLQVLAMLVVVMALAVIVSAQGERPPPGDDSRLSAIGTTEQR